VRVSGNQIQSLLYLTCNSPQTGSNGANLSFPQEFGIGPVEGNPAQSDRNEWILGVVKYALQCLSRVPALKLT
jgi:hypothetical protein